MVLDWALFGVTDRLRIILPALLMLSSAAFAGTPGDIYRQNKDSVYEVLVSTGKGYSQGSAVAITDTLLATNCHVLSGGHSITVGTSIDDKMVSAAFVGGDQQKDICFISVADLRAKPVKIGSTAKLQIGDTVYAIGAPKGLDRSLSKGIVSQFRGKSPKHIQHDAAITHGSSGGGLFDENGNLVGITDSGLEGTNINFAIPVEYIAELSGSLNSDRGTVHRSGSIVRPPASPIPSPPSKTENEWMAEASILQDRRAWPELQSLSAKWLEENPTSDSALWFLSNAKSNLKDYGGLLALGKQYTALYPSNVVGWDDYCDGLIMTKSPAHAVEACRQATVLAPDDSKT